jgi:NDP-sugar pyrophosphorylase family protein
MQNLQFLIYVEETPNALYPLTKHNNPKNFLPIGNKPLIAYTVELLERNYARDITLMCSDVYKQMKKYFDTNYQKLSANTKIQIHYNENDDILIGNFLFGLKK